jgi:CO/xanthine dehydrogenase Mo-binding subunit
VIAALMTWFGIGRSVQRIEDARFLRGRGRFVDDIHLPHQSFGVVLMSPHAHARIKSVDATEAKVAHGVICVLTGGDLIADNSAAYRRFSCRKIMADRKAIGSADLFSLPNTFVVSATALPS